MGKLIDLDRLSRFKSKLMALLPDEIHGKALTRKETIPSGADLNTYVTPGIYVCVNNSYAAQVSNIPDARGKAFTLVVLPNADTTSNTTFRQFCYYYDSIYIYERKGNTSSWDEWMRLSTKNEIDDTRKDIAILEDGTTATHNITINQFVVWKGSLYTAKNDISSGTTLSTSNLTSVSGGGLNNLDTKINTANTEISTIKNNMSKFAYVGSTGGTTATTYTKNLPEDSGMYIIITYHYIGSDTDVMGLYLLHVAGSTATHAVALLPVKEITHSGSSLSASINDNGVPILTFVTGKQYSYALIYKLA